MPITLDRIGPKEIPAPYMVISRPKEQVPTGMPLSDPPGPTLPPFMFPSTPKEQAPTIMPPPGPTPPPYMSLSYPPGPTPHSGFYVPGPIPANNGASISTEVFKYKCLVQIYHWQTTSFSRHKGSDTLLDGLNGFLDKFMETYMGKYGRPVYTPANTIQLGNITDVDAVLMLNQMTDYFVVTLPQLLDPVRDTDLLNIKDEILGEINQVKYLFTLA
jgi:hypothetical protein